MIVALKQVFLIHPIGVDRENMAMSTVIASSDFHAEAEFHGAQIGDVHIFKNAAANRRDEKGVPLPAAWVWYAGVPVSNVKAYILEGPQNEPQAKAKPSTLPKP